jgi:hypothetical protein
MFFPLPPSEYYILWVKQKFSTNNSFFVENFMTKRGSGVAHMVGFWYNRKGFYTSKYMNIKKPSPPGWVRAVFGERKRNCT